MNKLFIPDMYKESIYKINYNKLKSMNIKCLMFDLDNTLAAYTVDKPDNKLKELIVMLEEDFKVVIISNGTKDRVRPFKEGLNIDSAFLSKKPLKTKYKKILQKNKILPTEAACIGDQILTDVLGANRMGCISILINGVGTFEPVNTRFNRYWEAKILKKYNKKGVLIKGEYYD
ncbi:MAG: YqeG family HAD IIIA-type phosphatase [bacterium]